MTGPTGALSRLIGYSGLGANIRKVAFSGSRNSTHRTSSTSWSAIPLGAKLFDSIRMLLPVGFIPQVEHQPIAPGWWESLFWLANHDRVPRFCARLRPKGLRERRVAVFQHRLAV
jgi:hypothetical protein